METEALAEFLQEKVPMFITGSWVPATIRADNPELAEKLVAFTIPAKDSPVAPSFLGGSLMCRFTETQEPELAFELIKLVTTGDFATRWAEETNYFPGNHRGDGRGRRGRRRAHRGLRAADDRGRQDRPGHPVLGQDRGRQDHEHPGGHHPRGHPVQDAGSHRRRRDGPGFFSE